MRLGRSVLFVPLIVLVTSSAAMSQSDCAALLSDGIFETFRQTSSGYSASQFHQAMCNGTIHSVSRDSSSSAGVNFLGIDFSLGLSTQDAQRFQSFYQQTFCQQAAGAQQAATQNEFVTRLASREVLTQFNECVRLTSRGLDQSIFVRPDGRLVRFTLSFRKNQPSDPNPIVRNILISPSDAATCTGSIAANLALDENRYLLQCERNGTEAASITIDTSLGTVSKDLPAVPPPPTATDLVMAALPKGTILAFYSRDGRIPVGWALCNGDNGTPDLRDKFLRGTGDIAEVGDPGGALTHKHEATVLLPESNRKGSDWHWGETPWANGPNPVYTQTVNVSVAESEALPPYVQILFIMKL